MLPLRMSCYKFKNIFVNILSMQEGFKILLMFLRKCLHKNRNSISGNSLFSKEYNPIYDS